MAEVQHTEVSTLSLLPMQVSQTSRDEVRANFPAKPEHTDLHFKFRKWISLLIKIWRFSQNLLRHSRASIVLTINGAMLSYKGMWAG
jgi:hypothetical protein